MNTILKDNMKKCTYNYYFPGIVKTGYVQDQVFHLNRMAQDYVDPCNELIVHMPLEQEGQ